MKTAFYHMAVWNV